MRTRRAHRHHLLKILYIDKSYVKKKVSLMKIKTTTNIFFVYTIIYIFFVYVYINS